MSHRRFSDRQGRRWEIRSEASGAWRFEPVSGNPGPARHGRPPLYATDPFELSERELRTILRDADPVSGGGARPKTPGGPSPFPDDDQPATPERRSPFLDDD